MTMAGQNISVQWIFISDYHLFVVYIFSFHSSLITVLSLDAFYIFSHLSDWLLLLPLKIDQHPFIESHIHLLVKSYFYVNIKRIVLKVVVVHSRSVWRYPKSEWNQIWIFILIPKLFIVSHWNFLFSHLGFVCHDVNWSTISLCYFLVLIFCGAC